LARREACLSQERKDFHWLGEERLELVRRREILLVRRREIFIGPEKIDFNWSGEERLSLVRRGETFISSSKARNSTKNRVHVCLQL
jgi:hypothetical protein